MACLGGQMSGRELLPLSTPKKREQDSKPRTRRPSFSSLCFLILLAFNCLLHLGLGELRPDSHDIVIDKQQRYAADGALLQEAERDVALGSKRSLISSLPSFRLRRMQQARLPPLPPKRATPTPATNGLGFDCLDLANIANPLGLSCEDLLRLFPTTSGPIRVPATPSAIPFPTASPTLSPKPFPAPSPARDQDPGAVGAKGNSDSATSSPQAEGVGAWRSTLSPSPPAADHQMGAQGGNAPVPLPAEKDDAGPNGRPTDGAEGAGSDGAPNGLNGNSDDGNPTTSALFYILLIVSLTVSVGLLAMMMVLYSRKRARKRAQMMEIVAQYHSSHDREEQGRRSFMRVRHPDTTDDGGRLGTSLSMLNSVRGPLSRSPSVPFQAYREVNGRMSVTPSSGVFLFSPTAGEDVNLRGFRREKLTKKERRAEKKRRRKERRERRERREKKRVEDEPPSPPEPYTMPVPFLIAPETVETPAEETTPIDQGTIGNETAPAEERLSAQESAPSTNERTTANEGSVAHPPVPGASTGTVRMATTRRSLPLLSTRGSLLPSSVQGPQEGENGRRPGLGGRASIASTTSSFVL